MSTSEKYESLLSYIKSFDSMAIALSGGIDSAFLLHAASEALGNENVRAITIKTAYLPERDLNDAIEFCRNLKVNHDILEPQVPERLRPNPVDRCYYCKRFEFSLIIAKAKEYGINYVAAGLNADDPSDYRPGIKAMNELSVLYPLQFVSLTKNEIRELAQQANISLWNKPANACILSRIPYGDFITDETIDRIQKAEKILQQEGFVNPRVRTYGKIASIEVEKNEMVKFTNEETSLKIYDALKKLGYQNVTLDIRGYRTGSLNEGIIDQI
jgi:pyridinium-3,5-biscarboxylic acid mononucleotide sulfurtransferase